MGKQKPSEKQPPTVIIPSKLSSVGKFTDGETLQGVEETEITAQITVPSEGGWGWVVVFACSLTIAFMDGISFTFGAMFSDLTDDMKITASSAAFINAIAQAMYFMQSPVVSAYINRFGFRAACMTGSILVSFGLLCTYFTKSYSSVLFFYGILAGTGFCFINVSSLIVGFYFEKLRSLAMSICACGSSLGIMTFYPINVYIVQVAGWRLLILLHAGLNGLSFFLAMTYRPLLSLSVAKAVDENEGPSRTVTYLPSLKKVHKSSEVLASTSTERLFSAVANANYPTASAVVDKESETNLIQPGTSAATRPHRHGYEVTAQAAPGGMSTMQMNQVKDMMSKVSVHENHKTLNLTKIKSSEKPVKSSCWARLCGWEHHVPQSRPMYRDDVFYEGKLKNLPAYQKSQMDIPTESKTGLEYQLAVTRVASVADVRERRGIWTTSVRRVLSTMVAPKLLKKKSFILVCFSGLFLYVGFSVPYVFLQDRNLDYGLDPQHCALFVSAIGFMNIVGKLVIGAIACKLDPLKLYILVNILSGVSTIFSDFSRTLFYQYFYSCFFGFFISPTSGLRSMVLVNTYGLENLTNASGLVLLFQGLGSLVCTPVASEIKTQLGIKATFIWAGICLVISGLLLVPVQYLANKENKAVSTYLNLVFSIIKLFILFTFIYLGPYCLTQLIIEINSFLISLSI